MYAIRSYYDAVGDQALDRADARRGGRHLDEQVVAGHGGVQPVGRLHGAILVMGQRRRDLQAHIAGITFGLRPGVVEHVAGRLHIGDCERFVTLLGAQRLLFEGRQIALVIGIASYNFV